MKRESNGDILSVPCHTCHADAGQPCNLDAGEYCLMREWRVKRVDRLGVEWLHAEARGAKCSGPTEAGGCAECGQSVELLKGIDALAESNTTLTVVFEKKGSKIVRAKILEGERVLSVLERGDLGLNRFKWDVEAYRWRQGVKIARSRRHATSYKARMGLD